MKVYKGERLNEGVEVYVIDQATGQRYPLPLHLEIRNHSPTGFEFGYSGSGCAQLALAILADHFGPALPPSLCPFCGSVLTSWICTELDACGYNGEKDGDKWGGIQGQALHYQDFKRDIVSQLNTQGFEITGDNIDQWAAKHHR